MYVNSSDNKRINSDEEMLMLSGIQHFVFCPRQWALIHIEQAWADNQLTAEGNALHRNVNDASYRKVNNGKITYRAVHLASSSLRLYGIGDAIEMMPASDDTDSISLPGKSGRYIPFPIEYKHGRPKKDLSDVMQLVCQAICLEEMHDICIKKGAIFYWETMSREVIEIDQQLRQKAYEISDEMHGIFSTGKLPPPANDKRCMRCSLKDLCLPNLKSIKSANNYLSILTNEETA